MYFVGVVWIKVSPQLKKISRCPLHEHKTHNREGVWDTLRMVAQ